MRNVLRRIVLLGASFFGVALASACAEQGGGPLAPSGGAREDLLSSTVSTTVDIVQRLVPLESEVSASAEIGRGGGTISLPGTGLQVVFPDGAVSSPVQITVTAVKGASVAYTFQPHGITFRKPVTLKQEAALTGALGTLDVAQPRGAYFASPELLDADAGIAEVSEFRSTSYDALSGNFVWTIEHFSGYLLASN